MRKTYEISGRLFGAPLGFSERWERFLQALVSDGWLIRNANADTNPPWLAGLLPMPWPRSYAVALQRPAASALPDSEAAARASIMAAVVASGHALTEFSEWVTEIRTHVVEPTFQDLQDLGRTATRQGLPLIAIILGSLLALRILR